jgi:3',5'-cyclic AMP phosphodiesterase CpdA
MLTACGTTREPQAQPGSSFEHGIGGGTQPWTHERFDSSDDSFRFAVFSDLTGGEREGVFEVAIAQLNLLRPELIINVGDLIEGDEDRAVVDSQWDSFDQRAGRARAPVFYIGGNHDLLGQALQDAWGERLGPSYYHFVYRDVLFLVLNTDDYPPERLLEIAGLRRQAIDVAMTEGWDAFAETEYAQLPENDAGHISPEQSEYIRAAIADNPDVRWTFLFMHKAPWEREDLVAFADIEAALADRPYTIFHGHQHTYRHMKRKGRDYIRLATTGGVQMPENGRSMDQVVLITVDDEGVDIANLLMAGILDKTGHIPLGGEALCFESAVCEEAGGSED